MKKSMLIIIVGMLLLVCVTGCRGVVSTTITCESEKIGKSPVIVYYEVYKVRNNKIVGLEKYNVRTFDKAYLKRVKLEDVIKVYEKDKDTEVKKLNNHELKIIDTNPANVFKNSTPENMVDFIVDSMEKNNLSLYKFKCKVR